MSGANLSGAAELRAARNKGTWLFLWAFVFSIFVNILMLTGPLYMLQVYDRVLASRSIETLVALTLLVTALYGLMAVLDFARGRVMARIGARFQAALDARLFDASLQRPTSQPDQNGAGAALRSLDAVQSMFASPVLLAVMDMPWTPLFILAIFLFHPMLGWLAVVGGLIIVVLALVNHALTANRVRAAQAATQRAHTFADRSRDGAEVVASQGLAGHMRRRYLRLRNDSLVLMMKANDWTGSFSSATKSFRLLLQSLMLGAGAFFVIKGEMTPGSMIAGSILMGRALAPIEQAMGQWSVVQRGRAGWISLSRFLGAMPSQPIRTQLPVPPPELTAVNIAVVPPGTRTPILQGVSFRVVPGQALGVIGRSGSGKSTLARALVGYWPVAVGEIRLGGATLDQYQPERLGHHIGYLPQSVTLFAGTVAENIARMSLAPDDDAVVAAAKRSNAHDMIMRLPKGYDTWLDGNENQLSGGQKQRIALARALYGDPVMLILDEPNSALDSEGSEALNNTLREFKAARKSAIVMTHRPQAIAECDALMVLENGKMTALGPRDEILEKMLRNVDTVRSAIQRKAAF